MKNYPIRKFYQGVNSNTPRRCTNSGRILILSHIYPPAIDGGSQIIYKLVQVLKKDQSPEIKVITSDAYSTDDFVTQKNKRITQKNSRKVKRVKTIRWPGKLIRRITGPLFFGFPWLKIIKWKPDVIIGGAFPTTMPIYAWLASKMTGAEFQLVPCTHFKFENFSRFPLIPILKRADMIYSLTKQEKNFYIKNYKINNSKIIVFNPPVDKQLLVDKQFKPKFPKQPTLLFLGNHAAHKRIEMLIKGIEKIQSSNVQKFKKTKLIIAGKETLHTPKIKEMIADLPKEIRNKIDLQSEYGRKEQIKLIDQATVLINPSEFETLGLVFMEVWARKKPVIAANLDLLEEVIDDGKDGLFFEKDSLDDLVDKIREVIDDPNLAIKLGEKGYNKVKEKYDMNLLTGTQASEESIYEQKENF